MKKLFLMLAAFMMAVLVVPGEAKADSPSIPWTGRNPYMFAMGDSVMQQCGQEFGMGWRSLGFIGWPGAGTDAMRDRLSQTTEGWAWTTESSNAEERQWFRDAGSLVIALGTNDVKFISVQRWRENIDWFMTKADGRPVQWMTIHNPPYQAASDTFNAELVAATTRWPNLQLMDWDTVVDNNPSLVLASDQVHVATAEEGCKQSRNKLIQLAAPDVPDEITAKGYWYNDSRTTGPVNINGWGAGNDKTRRDPLWVNVRSKYQHVGRYEITAVTNDVWAQAASGRAFSITLPDKYRGTTISVDLVDSSGRFTSLGSRVV